MTEAQIRQICKAHGLCVDDIFRRMVAKGIPLNQTKHIYGAGDDEEYIVHGRKGFHIEKAITQEGRIEVSAVPGHFSVVMMGMGFMKWVDDPRDAILFPEEIEQEVISNRSVS